MASSSMAEQQQQFPPKEQQQHPCAVTQQSQQPNDLNQQQAKAPNGPSYDAYCASCYQKQQQYNDYSRAYPHHQLEASQIHSQGHSGCREGGGDGRGHDGGINLNKSMPPTPLPALKILCEICRVECNSLEMLAQHKNGKKHRKTVQRYEEMQKHEKAIAEYQTNSMPGKIHTIECQQANVMPSMHASGYQQENALPTSTMHLNSVIDNAPSVAEQEKVLPTPKSITKAEASSSQLEPPKASETTCNNVHVNDANKSLNEKLEQEGQVAATERTTELPNSVKQNGKVATTDGTVELSKIGNYSKVVAKQGGMKRIISNNSRGGKRLKKSKPEPLRICTVCNVTCESLIVFDAHIAGKKHLYKLRKFQQHGAIFGPIAVYIPLNQPIIIPTNRPDPIYFGLSTYQMVGQVMHSFDGAHLGNLQNQYASLVFAQKEKAELEHNVDNVANCAAQESDSKEIDDKLVDDGIGVCKTNDDALMSESKDVRVETGDIGARKTNDDALMSESKDVSVEMGDVAELLALDSELKEKNISEVSDTSKVAEDFALDSASKERNSNEAGDICQV